MVFNFIGRRHPRLAALSLHDALPISAASVASCPPWYDAAAAMRSGKCPAATSERRPPLARRGGTFSGSHRGCGVVPRRTARDRRCRDRKSVVEGKCCKTGVPTTNEIKNHPIGYVIYLLQTCV